MIAFASFGRPRSARRSAARPPIHSPTDARWSHWVTTWNGASEPAAAWPVATSTYIAAPAPAATRAKRRRPGGGRRPIRTAVRMPVSATAAKRATADIPIDVPSSAPTSPPASDHCVAVTPTAPTVEASQPPPARRVTERGTFGSIASPKNAAPKRATRPTYSSHLAASASSEALGLAPAPALVAVELVTTTPTPNANEPAAT